MKRLLSLFPWAAFGYVVAIGAGIHLWNARLGHPLPIEGTHGKWRGEYSEFADFVTVFGVWIYPLCMYGFIHFTRQGT
jgi:hypothetical protein